MAKAKLLKDIKGFDTAGIVGVIWRDAGEGTYIRVADLKGYDLSNVQIYRYNNFCRTMREVDKLEKDNHLETSCVKREDLISGNESKEDAVKEMFTIGLLKDCEMCKAMQKSILDKIRAEIEQLPITDTAIRLVDEVIDKYKAESDAEKRKEWPHKPCINYEDGCEEWAGCPCVHYKAESESER